MVGSLEGPLCVVALVATSSIDKLGVSIFSKKFKPYLREWVDNKLGFWKLGDSDEANQCLESGKALVVGIAVASSFVTDWKSSTHFDDHRRREPLQI